MAADLTPKVVSRALQVDQDTVINWCRRGIQVKQKNRRTKVLRLIGHKLGGRWFIPRRSLVAFLTQTGFPVSSDLTQILNRG